MVLKNWCCLVLYLRLLFWMFRFLWIGALLFCKLEVRFIFWILWKFWCNWRSWSLKFGFLWSCSIHNWCSSLLLINLVFSLCNALEIIWSSFCKQIITHTCISFLYLLRGCQFNTISFSFENQKFFILLPLRNRQTSDERTLNRFKNLILLKNFLI